MSQSTGSHTHAHEVRHCVVTCKVEQMLKVIRGAFIDDPSLRPAIDAQGEHVRVVCMQSHQTSVHRRPKLTPYHPLPRCRSARGVHAKSSDECPSTTQAYAPPSTPK
eukprot:5770217-Amphidinium_carterae.1